MPWIDLSIRVTQNPPSVKELQQVQDHQARKAKARFLADENFPGQAVKLVRVMGGKVQTARMAGLEGHPDEDYLAYARRDQHPALVLR
jgi:Domain of unknown function (DUF5615)